MKELKIHYNEGGNLLSIKPIENTYPDRSYLISTITTLFALTNGCVYIEVSRPNYDIPDLKVRLKAILDDYDVFTFTDFEISFVSLKMSDDLLKLLSIIWFAYEHTSFCFFTEDIIEFEVRRKTWNEITFNSKSYVLFKGIEENVIWIGKSDKLDFSTIK